MVYLWGLINPLAWIGALILCFSIVGKQIPIFTDILSFMIPGMLSYILFRNTIQSIIRSKKTSHSLLYIPFVKPMDILCAAALVELLNCFAVFVVLNAFNYIAFNAFECADPLLMIYGYACAWGTGIVMGILFATISRRSPILEKMIPILLRPTFWISGIFFTANELPSWLDELASWNPLFQSIEIIRDGTFFSYHSRTANHVQPLVFILCISLICFLLQRSFQSSLDEA